MKIHNRCAESRYLPQLVEEQLSARERVRMEIHLEQCATCQDTLDSLIGEDATSEKVCSHLRQPNRVSDAALLDVMARMRSTTGGTATPEPMRLDDFAVDYLHPSQNKNALGRLGPYEIDEIIGSGGMGIVLKGRDTKLNRIVAVKVLAPAFALNSTARKRFVREAQAAAAVGHPNVVTIHSVGEDRLPYLVMEYVDGPSLQTRLDAEGFLQLPQILRIGIQIAAGLSAAHAQGLVHRDVKPGNILLENGMERVKLTDFGLARAADDASVTREGTIVGTPQYMSPEQARGESVDPKSDLFSLGSVLYAMATGRPPFRAESSYGVMRKITDDAPTPIRELNADIPDWLCTIIGRLMAKEKGDRFSSAAAVHELMEACLSHAQQPGGFRLPEIPTPRRTGRFTFTRSMIAGVTLMATIAASLLVALGVPPMLFSPPTTAQRAPTKEQRVRATGDRAEAPAYRKEFVVTFPNPAEPGTLNVDIKRGSIHVLGYEGHQVIVELTVPGESRRVRSEGGMQTLRPNTLDFDIERSHDQIKLDGNSYDDITNLMIKVPRNTNLILDSYRDGVIHVERVTGSFDVRSHNNDIRVEDVSGYGRFWSYNGSLFANFRAVSDARPLEFETYNGSIDVWLPPDVKANTKYRSGSGRVSTDFAIALSEDIVRTTNNQTTSFDEFVRGTLNGGGPTLTLVTEKGDIRFRRRMKDAVR